MIEEDRVVDAGDVVRFGQTGDQAKGAYRCADCGYGIAVVAALPRCPMCGGTLWDEAAWSPFGRSADRP